MNNVHYRGILAASVGFEVAASERGRDLDMTIWHS